ncbi:hypothetical protein HanRHA438_Chr07g0310841 [Helianthus annuus]|uniref:Uncharacterized protein n=1 Tax=Helianthus annuus TaxID=4232 RepID=A0A251VHM9_HELAN|nr:uncharacterized protein LOC110907149 [Helianthus annuus]KAF5799104.1 hypothetical protein HanXRQr2_Chr07g0300711 [Helianthus annuus]KAJ0557361.1 hypothetical protein HanIR_Chr07g0324311 [Helianthus annuus]KAJ0905178.1 hypothetical protein HanPSC8_Chr07g0290991 [Helianthus annuus]KAJ0908473.1 hypothetical protein HanRHA438_Chr07g0310841 [Helianthus annuus]
MASEGGHTNDATARRRRIAEKGSDRLALITAGRTSNPPTSSNASLTDENLSEIGGSKVQPVSRKPESTKMEAPSENRSSPPKSKHDTSSKMKIYLYKTVSPSQLQPAILASQDTRRKCSFFVGIVAVLSYLGFPILGSYVIRSILLSRPLVLLLFINVSITVGPLLLDAMMLIQQELNNPSEEADLPDNMGSPFEWGMLFKAGLSALFMDSCIYSVVVICATSFFQKFGL